MREKTVKILQVSLAIIFSGTISFLMSAMPEIQSQDQNLTVEFCIADIKYNDNALKILEFGGGPRSGFDGYDRWFGFGAAWKSFWNYLAQFNLPMWYMRTPSFTSPIGKRWLEFISYETFLGLGGRFALDPEEVEKYISAFSLVAPDGTYPDYKGAFLMNISRHRPEYGPMNSAMRNKFPSALFINEIADKFVFNKSKTDRLFRDDELRQYRPKSMVCFKRYDSGLALKIINTMQCDMFVIKPLNAQYGKGIIFVKKEELDSMLNTILVQVKKPTQTRVALNQSIAYWSEDKSSRFMIEEYVPSKLVELDGKKYDATLRAIFAMHCLNKKITITLLGAYWKLPIYGIDDEASLNEVHQSHQYDREIFSLPVDPVDLGRIRAILTTSLTRVYAKMIAQTKDKKVKKQLILTKRG